MGWQYRMFRMHREKGFLQVFKTHIWDFRISQLFACMCHFAFSYTFPFSFVKCLAFKYVNEFFLMSYLFYCFSNFCALFVWITLLISFHTSLRTGKRFFYQINKSMREFLTYFWVGWFDVKCWRWVWKLGGPSCHRPRSAVEIRPIKFWPFLK